MNGVYFGFKICCKGGFEYFGFECAFFHKSQVVPLYTKGERACVIRAAWSPNVCLIERRVNAVGLYDEHKEMHVRAVTFEGNEHESQSAPLTGTIITQQIQRACNAVVDHVAEVSSMKHRVSRMARGRG